MLDLAKLNITEADINELKEFLKKIESFMIPHPHKQGYLYERENSIALLLLVKEQRKFVNDSRSQTQWLILATWIMAIATWYMAFK